MFTVLLRKKNSHSEGESPFWISFSDLMSALMTLFLVVMVVTVISITKSIPKSVAEEAARQEQIKIVMGLLKSKSEPFQKVHVDATNYRIDLGEIVRFNSASSTISPEAATYLKTYVPVLLEVAKAHNGKLIKRFVIEGFTDQDGSYTYNLKLSLDRSFSVICAFVSNAAGQKILTPEELRLVQELFLVGGFSFNSIREDKAASRRVEIRVEFWELGEKEKLNRKLILNKDFGAC